MSMTSTVIQIRKERGVSTPVWFRNGLTRSSPPTTTRVRSSPQGAAPANVPGYKNRPAGLTQQKSESPRITDPSDICTSTRACGMFRSRTRSQRGNNLPHIRDRACGISSAPRPPHTVSHLPEGGHLCLSLRSIGPAATKTHAATRDATATHYTFHVDYHSSQCPMEPSPPVNASMCGSSRLSCMRAAATPSRLPLPSAIGAALATK